MEINTQFSLEDFRFKNNTLNSKSRYGKEKELRPLVIKGHYIRTLPLDWISRVCQLSPKTLAVGVALWRVSGLTKSAQVNLTTKECALFHVSRASKRKGLMELERAGLIGIVSKQSGKNPVVEILQSESPASLEGLDN